MNEEYNGWKNKPTWLVYTWLSNDYYTDLDARGVSKYGAASLREYVEGFIRLDEREGLELDLLTWTLGDVDWDDLVEAFKKG